jgi:hypothetical protein
MLSRSWRCPKESWGSLQSSRTKAVLAVRGASLDPLLAGVHLLGGTDSGDEYMGMIEDPARCPERWKPIPTLGFLAPARKDELVFPTCYFVLLGDGRYGLALPGRRNGGRLGWSGNEQLLTKVALILADAGILRMERHANQ